MTSHISRNATSAVQRFIITVALHSHNPTALLSNTPLQCDHYTAPPLLHRSSLHCTHYPAIPLQCTSLHCTHYTAPPLLHCTSLHCNPTTPLKFHCTACTLNPHYSNALYGIVPATLHHRYSTSLNCIATPLLQWISLHCIHYAARPLPRPPTVQAWVYYAVRLIN